LIRKIRMSAALVTPVFQADIQMPATYRVVQEQTIFETWAFHYLRLLPTANRQPSGHRSFQKLLGHSKI
jgi:hypothetical protein